MSKERQWTSGWAEIKSGSKFIAEYFIIITKLKGEIIFGFKNTQTFMCARNFVSLSVFSRFWNKCILTVSVLIGRYLIHYLPLRKINVFLYLISLFVCSEVLPIFICYPPNIFLIHSLFSVPYVNQAESNNF